MAELKTKPTGEHVTAFLNTVSDPVKRADCFRLVGMMERISGAPATMWGPAIIGFGLYHYKYASGHEGDFFRCGFSPRKANLTLYIIAGFNRYEELLGRLGKYKTGKSCLYLKKLDDVDQEVLEELITLSLMHMKQKWG